MSSLCSVKDLVAQSESEHSHRRFRHTRTAGDGEIPDVDLTPPVTDGPNPAGRTAHDLGRRLDEQPQLVVGLGR